MQRLHPLRIKTRPTRRTSAGHRDRNISAKISSTNTPSTAPLQQKGKAMTQAHFYSKPTSVYWTCKALLDKRTISQLTQIQNVKGWRLGAIIHRLRHEYGWPIHTEYTSPGHIAFYSLAPGTDPATLRFPKSAMSLHKMEGRA